MAGGGSSELQELKEMVDGIIAEMEARIAKLEKLVLAGLPHGGGVSGGKKKLAGASKKLVGSKALGGKKKPGGKKK